MSASCADADGDLYEDEACNPDPLNGGGDCDDTDPLINPGMPEICADGIDNDCDGLVDQNDPDCATELTQITLAAPQNLSTLSQPPTFAWTPDGGANCGFAVDLAIPPVVPLWSTYTNLHIVISENNWTMPAAMWSLIPSGSRVFWRVRGADLDQTPLTIITCDGVWSFYKQ